MNLSLRAWLLVIVSSLGCSSSSSPSAPNPDGSPPQGNREAGSEPHDAGREPDTSRPADAAEEPGPQEAGSLDGAIADPLGALKPCLGTSMPLTISGQMPYVVVPIGTLSGEFVLDFASTFSSIDLSAFPSPGPMTSGCDPSELGVVCTVADFAFFSAPGDVPLTTGDFSGILGSVRQAGIIATDLLSEHVITLGYADKVVFASPASGLCSDDALEGAGFVALSTAGFYENDPSLLEAETLVDSAAPSDTSVPNVPTVSVSVAGASALAQLDTGFDDDVTPFSVNINPAFLAAIMAASPSAVVRDTSLDTTLSTCLEGVDESVQAYRLAAGTTFDFVGKGGTVARSYADSVLFVKNTPASAASCGGIGTWTVPAAQVAASYYNDMQALVFDPYSARVWIPSRP